MNDWDNLIRALVAALHGASPYTEPGFYSPPWLLIFLVPLSPLPRITAHFFPLLALGYAAHHSRKPLLIPVVALSVPFLSLMSTGNIDWIAMLGALSFGRLQAVMLSVKPQAAGFALVAYLHRDRWRYLLPLAALVVAGYALWRWPVVLIGANPARERWNVSQVPYTWPIGIYALWRCWRDGDLMWGCIASLSVSPYFSTISLVPLHYKVAERHRRIGVLLSVASWFYVVLVVMKP